MPKEIITIRQFKEDKQKVCLEIAKLINDFESKYKNNVVLSKVDLHRASGHPYNFYCDFKISI